MADLKPVAAGGSVVVDRWSKEERERLHKRLDQMLNHGDRVLLIGLGDEGTVTTTMFERTHARFPKTSPIELLGAIERVKYDLVQDINASTEEVSLDDKP